MRNYFGFYILQLFAFFYPVVSVTEKRLKRFMCRASLGIKVTSFKARDIYGRKNKKKICRRRGAV